VSPQGSPSPDRFRLICEVGQGGMATVYLALMVGDAGFSKLVALKVPKPGLAKDDEFLAMFLDEARLAARLNHPHVVQTYEVGRHGEDPFIAMEFLEGQPLHRVQRTVTRGVPLPIHLRIIADALSGLHHAHELCDFNGAPLSVVHRDVSPQNVLVGYDGETKVVDFGIAKAVSQGSHTELGLVKGKLPYMSPEQILGEALDRRADIFSVGVMLWEAGARARLWPNESARARLRLLSQGDIPKLSELDAKLPVGLDRICRRALQYAKARRYESAVELEADVDRLIAELGEPATRREVSEFMRAHFEADRRRTRKLIEEQLGHVSLDSARRLQSVELSHATTQESAPGTRRLLAHTPLSAAGAPGTSALPVVFQDHVVDTATTVAPATATARDAAVDSARWKRWGALGMVALGSAVIVGRVLFASRGVGEASVQISEQTSSSALVSAASSVAAIDSAVRQTNPPPPPDSETIPTRSRKPPMGLDDQVRAAAAPARARAEPATSPPSVEKREPSSADSDLDLAPRRKREIKPTHALDTSDPWAK
jgi:serine/threonine protein kinase